MIEVSGLTKRYRDTVAVDDLSFTVEEGDLFALLGENGAGKSTTISCLTTLLDYDSGDISVDGLRRPDDDYRIREQTGVVFQQSILDPLLTARENLRLRATFYGLGMDRVDELTEMIGLGEFIDRRYGVLSGGQKRRVDIARSLLNRPRTLLLDEPTAGLDPGSRSQVWESIQDLRDELGLTIVLTTHYMQETESADDVLVLDHGKVLARGTPIALRAAHSAARLLLAPAPGHQYSELTDILLSRVPQADWRVEGGSVVSTVPDSATALAVLKEAEHAIADFQFIQGSMDDVFLNLTEGGAAPATRRAEPEPGASEPVVGAEEHQHPARRAEPVENGGPR